jgi:hypothetical protein
MLAAEPTGPTREGISVERPAWAPAELDLDRPNAARMYDYYLGGSHNFSVDRQVAVQAVEAWPDMPRVMQANRAFLRRAVRFLVSQGIRQFLDIGSGIPTVGNVHEVAHAADPDVRVVYVDTDPIAVAHSRAILAGDERTAVVEADGRKPETLLADPGVRGLLDLDQPVGLLMVALLHFVPDDDDPAGVVARYRSALAPGSYLALTHASADGRPDYALQVRELYRRTPTPLRLRNRAEFEALLAGWDPVEPGVVFVPAWRPEYPEDVDEDPGWTNTYGAVGLRT